jgi:hypothetical protein
MPAADQSGSARITVTVTDGSLSSSQAFQLVVQPVNDPPQILGLTDLNTLEDVPLGPVPFTVLDAESPAAALLVNAFSDNPQLLPPGALVLAGQGSSRELTITPAANQNGLAHLTVTVSDGETTTQRTILLTVNAVNDTPTLNGLPAMLTMTEDSRLTVSFTINDVDSSVDGLVVAAISDNPGLINLAGLQLAGTGGGRTLTLVPAPDQSGTASIALTVNDGILTVQHIFQLVVTSVNDPPVINGLNDYQMEEDGLAFLSFSITDVDTPVGELAINAVSDNAQLFPPGAATVSRNGADWMLTLRPAANQNGTAQLTVSAFDGFATTIQRFRVTVRAVNDWPQISGGIADKTIQENGQLGPLTFTISDVESPVTSLLVTAASDNPQLLPPGSLVLSGEGAERTLTVTPVAHQSGSARITVTVSDGELPASQTFLLTVAPVNDAPFISGLSASQTIPEDGRLVVTFKVQDIDSPVDSLVAVATGDNPSLLPATSLQVSGTGENRILAITPAPDQSGTANITVTVSDGALEDRKTFQLVVSPVNDPPTITGLGDYQMNEDNLGLISFFVKDIDSPANDLSVSASADDSQLFPPGSLVLNKSGGDWVLTLKPAANQNGVARVTVIAADGLAVVSQTVQVTVRPANDAPFISGLPGSQTLPEDGRLVVTFKVQDIDSPVDSLVAVAVGDNPSLLPANSLQVNGTGENRILTITPAPDQSGTANITVAVSDGALEDRKTFQLVVTPINDPPVIAGLGDYQMDENNLGLMNFRLTDIDSPAGDLSVSASADDSQLFPPGSLVLNKAGRDWVLTLKPAANQNGVGRITVIASDGLAVASMTVQVTVKPVNNAPQLIGLTDQIMLEDGVLGPLPFTVSDLETPAAALTVAATSDNLRLFPPGSVVMGGQGSDRTLKATPSPNENGTAHITVTVSDGELSSPQVILLTVQPVNDAPIITGLKDISLWSGASGSVDFSVADVDNDPGSHRISLMSDNPSLIPENTLTVEWNGTNGAIRIRPATNQTGTARITLSVSDGSLAAVQSFIVVVANENRPPTITGLTNEVTLRPGASQAVVSFLIDDDTQAVNVLQLAAVSDNSALLPNGGLHLEGTTGARTLTLTPNGGQAGRARITLTLSDGINTTTQTFDFIVPANTPRIQVVRPAAGGPLLLKWEGLAGITYRVEFSSDLTAWVSLGELSATGGQCEFVDQTAGAQLRRFYRVLIR